MPSPSNIDELLAALDRQKKSFDEAQRPREIRKRESELGLSDISGYQNSSPLAPPTPLEKAAAFFNLGLTKAAELASLAGKKGSEVMGYPNASEDFAKNTEVYRDRAGIYEDYLRSGGAGKAEKMAIWAANNWPEFVNPTKSGAANALIHATRGYLEGGVPQAGISGLSNIVGENMEDSLTRRIPGLSKVSGIPGNVLGMTIEEGAAKVADVLRDYYNKLTKNSP